MWDINPTRKLLRLREDIFSTSMKGSSVQKIKRQEGVIKSLSSGISIMEIY